MYADELHTMDISEYIAGRRIANAAAPKSTFKQCLRELIWLRQARPGIGFAITQIATQIVEAFESPAKECALANLYNKIARFVKNHRVGISYIGSPLPNYSAPLAPSMFLGWKLFVFTDAGFGTLVRNRSSESHVIILGDVIERDGIVKCPGLTMGRRCAKMHRVCMSTLADEANAAVTAVGVALWFQVLLAEIFTHHFDYKRRAPPNEFPLINPFRESPTKEEIKQEASLGKIHSWLITSHAANHMREGKQEVSQSTCECCNLSTKLTTLTLGELNHTEQLVYKAMGGRRPAVLFHPMILTDC